MEPQLVEIVNPNGRKGLVAVTSRAARLYKRPPSARGQHGGRESQEPVLPDLRLAAPYIESGELPPGNATTETWRAYGLAKGLPSEQVTAMTRDQLVDHFTTPDQS